MRFAVYTGSIYRTDIHFSKAKGKRKCNKDDSDYYYQVLSFAKALPLLIYSDKGLAERLHARDHEKFGDANHKS